MRSSQPTTDEWVERILADPGEVRHLKGPVIADLLAVLEARQHDADTPVDYHIAMIGAAISHRIRRGLSPAELAEIAPWFAMVSGHTSDEIAALLERRSGPRRTPDRPPVRHQH